MRNRSLSLLLALALSSGCTYTPECSDRPRGHFSNPVDLVETGDLLYVSNGNNRNTLCYQFITRVDKSEFLSTEDSSEVGRHFIETGTFPGTLALDPSHQFLYTVSRRDNELHTISLQDQETVSILPINDDPYGLALLPDMDGNGMAGLALGTLDSTFINLFDLDDPANPSPYDADRDLQNGISGVDAGGPANAIPERITVDPAGGRAWSLFQTSFSGQLATEIRWNSEGFETETLALDLAGVEAARSDAAAYEENTQSLWISARLTDTADQFLSNVLIRYDLALRRIADLITLEDGAVVRSLALSGGRLYATVYGADNVWVFDSTSGAFLDKIGAGDGPTLVKSSQDGNYLWVLNYLSSTLMAIGSNPALPDYHKVVRVLE